MITRDRNGMRLSRAVAKAQGRGAFLFLSDRQISDVEVSFWGASRFVGAAVALAATIGIGSWLDAWPGSWLSLITSPLTAIFTLGLPLFPGGALLFLTAIYNIAMANAAKHWPTWSMATAA
jgi:hypothetical protein